jgi:uncharacterized membrane protein HdeD (DUF308 family)
MDPARGAEVRLLFARLGRSWGWIVAYGVASVLLGIAAVIWPGATLVVIAIIFAVQLLVATVYQFVFAFALPGETGWLRALVAVIAIIGFAIALYLIGHVGLTLLLLAILLGVYWIAQGVIEVLIGIEHPELQSRAWVIVSGVLSVLAGAIVVIFPGTSLVFLTIVLGIWLIIFGVGLIGRGWMLRSQPRAIPRAAA